MLDAQEGPGQVDGDQPVPFDKGKILERREAHETGVVHETVAAAEAPFRLAASALDRLLGGDVACRNGDFDALRPQPLRDRLDALLLEIEQHESGAGSGEDLGSGFAEPLRRAGDDDHFSLQIYRWLQGTPPRSMGVPSAQPRPA